MHGGLIVVFLLLAGLAYVAFSDVGERQDWPDWENDDDHHP